MLEDFFKRSKKGQAEGEKKAGEDAGITDKAVMFDNRGMPHVGETKEEAAEKMRQANEGYK